ncbi:Fic family protein [bacterium]|nr:Fic family protein [bacterium]
MKKEGRYSTQGSIEDHYEPGSGNRVLKNKMGIKKIHEMDQVENDELLRVLKECTEKYDIVQRFNARDICNMHKMWLGSIYLWAGKYRSVNLTKNTFAFASVRLIPKLMQEFEEEILKKYTPCNYNEKDKVAEALAIVHVELVLIHPFREGNGRLARLLADLMAMQANLPPLVFRKLSQNKPRYHRAIQAGLDRNYKPMKKLFVMIIEDSLRSAS